MSIIVSEEEVKRIKDGERNWKTAIDAAIAHRNSKIGFTKKYMDMYRDKFDMSTLDEEEHRVTVNMVFANTSVLVPLIYFKNPNLSVTPKRPHKMVEFGNMQVNPETGEPEPIEPIPDYELMERVANHQIDEIEYYKTGRLSVLDCSIIGTAIQKVGYSQKFKHDKLRGVTFVEEDELWIQRVDPHQFLVDPLALDESSARWMGEELYIPFTEAVKMYGTDVRPTHKWTVQEKNSEKGTLSYARIADEDQQYDPELAIVHAYEIWDITEQRVFVVQEGDENEKPLEEFNWPYESLEGRYPYVSARFHEDPESFWGLSPVKVYESQQQELNFHRSKLAAIHGRTARKYIAMEGAFEPEELEKLEKGRDGAIIIAKTLPERAFKPVQEQVFQNDMAIISQVVKDDINLMSGVDEATRGSVTKGRTTATEISRLTQGLEIRSNDKRTQIEKLIRSAWKIAVNLMVEMMVGEQYTNFYDENRETPTVVAFRREELGGNFDVNIEVGDTQLPNKEVRQQLLINLAQLILQSPTVNHREFFRQVFKSFDLDPSGMLNSQQIQDQILNAQLAQQQGAPGAQESVAGEPTTAGNLRALGGSGKGLT